METAKDKAKSLVDRFMEDTKYFGATYIGELTAIECAKIAVDEIIKELQLWLRSTDYWQEVKNELNKM